MQCLSTLKEFVIYVDNFKIIGAPILKSPEFSLQSDINNERSNRIGPDSNQKVTFNPQNESTNFHSNKSPSETFAEKFINLN